MAMDMDIPTRWQRVWTSPCDSRDRGHPHMMAMGVDISKQWPWCGHPRMMAMDTCMMTVGVDIPVQWLWMWTSLPDGCGPAACLETVQGR